MAQSLSEVPRVGSIGCAHLYQAGIEWDLNLPSSAALCAEEKNTVRSQIIHKLNSPPTSSVGRFFDAVASIIGICQEANYEAQAAIELEAVVDPTETGAYPVEITLETEDPAHPDARQLLLEQSVIISSVVDDYLSGIPTSVIAARFHNSLANAAAEVCQLLKERTGLTKVVLSGGVWQNITLLEKTIDLLKNRDFKVYYHNQVPTNDGGFSLGQAAIAAYNLHNTGR